MAGAESSREARDPGPAAAAGRGGRRGRRAQGLQRELEGEKAEGDGAALNRCMQLVEEELDRAQERLAHGPAEAGGGGKGCRGE